MLNDLNDGLEQLRRSYSPPGSPYHTFTTLPAHQPSPQLPAQQLHQQFVAPPTAPQQPPQSSWAFQPAATMLPAQPYGFDMRPVTSLLMPTLQPAATPAPSPAGGAPIIQYISTYHSPSSSTAASGADPNTRPATAAMPAMPPPLLGQPQWQQVNSFPGMAHSPQHLQYHYQLPYPPPQQPPQQQPVFEQRPYTPTVGLAHGGMMAAVPGATPGAAAQQPPPGYIVVPPSPTGVLAAGLPSRHTTGTGTVPGTARPRSSGRNKVGLLGAAVPLLALRPHLHMIHVVLPILNIPCCTCELSEVSGLSELPHFARVCRTSRWRCLLSTWRRLPWQKLGRSICWTSTASSPSECASYRSPLTSLLAATKAQAPTGAGHSSCVYTVTVVHCTLYINYLFKGA